MVTKSFLRKGLFVAALAVFALSVCAPFAFAQEHPAGTTAGDANVGLGAGIRAAGLAIGAGIAILGGALGTGRAQAGIGAGGTGVLAEKPELFTTVLILVAIPETIVILGFVIAFLLLGRI